MSTTGKRVFPRIVEAVIQAKSIPEDGTTAETIRTDAAAILALVAECSEEVVVAALQNQGFHGDAYRSTLRALVAEATARRTARTANSLG